MRNVDVTEFLGSSERLLEETPPLLVGFPFQRGSGPVKTSCSSTCVVIHRLQLIDLLAKLGDLIGDRGRIGLLGSGRSAGPAKLVPSPAARPALCGATLSCDGQWNGKRGRSDVRRLTAACCLEFQVLHLLVALGCSLIEIRGTKVPRYLSPRLGVD